MKNKQLASQFPSIYRRITEGGVFKRLSKMTFIPLWRDKLNKPMAPVFAILTFFMVVLLLAGIGVFIFKTYDNFNKTQQVSLQRQGIQEKINFWQSIANKYEGYKDAYFQMAVLDYQLGNFQKARQENLRTLILDPNFEDAKKLELILADK
jgi:hypothetical protein